MNKNHQGTVIAATVVEDFLVETSNTEARDEFHKLMEKKYKIKLPEKPTRFLGWLLYYSADGTIAFFAKTANRQDDCR